MRIEFFTRAAGAAFAFAVVPALAQQAPDLDTSPRLRLVEEVRIGNATDPKLGFSSIGAVTVDRDGNVYAFEVQEAAIRVFSPAGTLLRTIGRRGDGPGEFRDAASPIGVKGDTLWVSARGVVCGRKIMLFKRDGTLISSTQMTGLRVATQNNIGVVLPMGMRADGKFVSGEASCFTGGVADVPRTYAATDTVRIPRVLFDTKGTLLDTLGWYSHLPYPRITRDTIMIEGRRHAVPTPYPDVSLIVALMDGRIAVDRPYARTAAQATIRVTRTRLAGDTVYSRVLRYTPTRYISARLDSIAMGDAKNAGGFTVTNGVPTPANPFANMNAAAALIRSKLNYPGFQLPVSYTFLGADDGLWLHREDDGGPSHHWVLLDPQGVPRGRLDVPRPVRIVWSSGNTVWAVVPDSDDVPWLVKYRIAP